MKFWIVPICIFCLIKCAIAQDNLLIDLSFADNGELSLSFGPANNTMSGVALLPDGKIILVCASELNTEVGIKVAKLFPDGDIDLSFGDNGMLELPGSDYGYNYSVYAFTAPDGDIIVLSGGYTGIEDESVSVWKFDEDGVPDPLFGTNGVLFIPEFSLYWWYMTPYMDEDGILYVTGMNNGSEDAAPGLVVIEPDGQFNFNFALDARLLLKSEYLEAFWKIHKLPDGRFVLYGRCTDENSINYWRMVMASSDGSVDENFGNEGLMTWNSGCSLSG